MRTSLLVAATLGLCLSTTAVSATVTQPNGVVMPLDSMNGEVQMYTLFSQLGEPIDWQLDANATPDTFSPLCDFTATLVLNQTASVFAIGWYNATNQPPAPADIHVIVPPGSPVGTIITSSDIKNDPAYLGGLIGFALVGGQTHFSEAQWDPVCTGCNPPGPWVSAMIYASKNTPNAYYVAFEDGPMGPNPGEFNNDGDYNDYVYFLTGLTCDGGGQVCDTGLPGICAAGITQCSPTGVTCEGLTSAEPVETCNGLDDDCNGDVDEGDICPSGFVCDKGTCVEKCGGSEFQCPPSKVCNRAGYCVDPTCEDVTCDAGTICVGGVCKAPCDDVVCPHPGVCRVGRCVDPCETVSCGVGQVCDAGVCVLGCSCAPCSPSLGCDPATDICVDPACVGVACDPGTHCEGGDCIDSCTGAACPADQICEGGACVPGGSGGGAGSTSVGFGVGGGGGPAGSGGAGGAGGSQGSASGGGGSSSGGTGDDGGCGCRLADRPDARASFFALLLALGAVWTRRRRG